MQRLVWWELVGSVQEQLTQLITGFHEVCPLEIVHCFSVTELRNRFDTEDKFDVDELERDAKYNNCNKNTREIQWLFEELRRMSQTDLKRFVQFMSGKTRLPVRRFKGFRFYYKPEKESLMYASTCSCQLNIFAERSKEQFVRKFWISMDECEGFHRS